jgi:hypothetical protein
VFFLETVLLELHEVVPLAVRKMWFQNDRAPSHYEEDIRQWLDGEGLLHGLLGRWIFASGIYLKKHVYAIPPRTV